MPGRLRQSTAARGSEKERHYNIPGLDFDEPLSWRAGKAISVTELLSALEKLSNELRKLEQEDVESDSYKVLARDLANTNLIGHKDKGVRAWAICCIVDVLRLCAPEAPFVGDALRVSCSVGLENYKVNQYRTFLQSSLAPSSLHLEIPRMPIMLNM